MSKIELDNVASGYNLEVINRNFQKIEDELNTKVLYRNNPSGEPNQMTNSLDMNGRAILNASNIGGGGGGGASDAVDVTFAPTGTISSTNVQSAIVEVQSDIPAPAINFPLANQVAAQIGTSVRYAKEDHVHPGTGGGGGGADATSTGLVYAYKRATSLPLDNPGDVTFNFTVAAITLPSGNALANGWTKAIPSGTNPLYVTVASASSTGPTDNIAAAEWATPVILAQDGANGTNGLNAATVYIYQRNNTGTNPTLPSVTTTYQFTPPLLTGLNNGWTTTVPAIAGGQYLYVSTATAVSNTSTDTIGSSEWAAVQKMAQNGAAGSPGANGSDGTRGTVNIASGGNSSWSDSVATAAIASAGYGTPINRDIVTLYGPSFSQTRFYNGGSWTVLTAYINGNLLVSGTLSAATITSGTLLTDVIVRFGTGHTTSNKAFEITSGGIVQADNLLGGVATFFNDFHPTLDAVQGTAITGAQVGIRGTVASSNSNANAHGMAGKNTFNGTSGLVGAANGYDFYADGSGTNFGPFTGAHDALILKGVSVELGDILVDKERVSRGYGVSNTIFTSELSNTPEQKAVIGIVSVAPAPLNHPPTAFTVGYGEDWTPIIASNYEETAVEYDRVAVNALGEGLLNVVGEGGDIEAGDFIVTSSVSGKGMRQSDGLLHNYTVARAREACTFTGSEVKQVACIYLCG